MNAFTPTFVLPFQFTICFKFLATEKDMHIPLKT